MQNTNQSLKIKLMDCGNFLYISGKLGCTTKVVGDFRLL
jgi:hypothetical protein